MTSSLLGPRSAPDEPIRIAFQIWGQSASWTELMDAGQRVEALGFASLFANDHLMPILGDADGPVLGSTGPVFEGWMTLGAWAARTTRIPLGVMVCGVGYRNVALTVKMATALDHASAGRAMLGLGAGWHEPEHRAFGYEMLTLGDRISRFDEASRLARGMLDGEPYTPGRSVGQRPRGPQRSATRPGPDAAPHRRQRRAADAADRGPRRRHLERRGRSGDVRPQERGPRRPLRRDRSRPGLDPAHGRRPAGLHPGVPRGGGRGARRDPGPPRRRRCRRPAPGPPARRWPIPRRPSSACSVPGARPGRKRPWSTCRARSTTRRSSAWPAPSGSAWRRDRAHGCRRAARRIELMRAAVYEGEGRLVVRDVPDPLPAPDEVLIEVEACGVCGSDVQIINVPPGHPSTPPVIIGHEFVGWVRAVGSAVQRRAHRAARRRRSRSQVRRVRLVPRRPTGQLHQHRRARRLPRRGIGALRHGARQQRVPHLRRRSRPSSPRSSSRSPASSTARTAPRSGRANRPSCSAPAPSAACSSRSSAPRAPRRSWPSSRARRGRRSRAPSARTWS